MLLKNLSLFESSFGFFSSVDTTCSGEDGEDGEDEDDEDDVGMVVFRCWVCEKKGPSFSSSDSEVDAIFLKLGEAIVFQIFFNFFQFNF